MKIVKFEDGTYAIRKFGFSWCDTISLGYQYLTLDTGSWYDIDNYSQTVLRRCVTNDINRLIEIMNGDMPQSIDYGTPIDTDEESFWNKIKNNKKKLTSFQDKVSIKLTELDEAIEEREQ